MSDTVMGAGRLVLIIDDEEPVRMLTQAALEAFGYRVLSAGGGMEAVELYRERHAEVALVIVDQTMPEMDGPATLRVLRQINPAVRVIVASGVEASPHLQPPPVCFLSKPFNTRTLLGAVQQVLAAPT